MAGQLQSAIQGLCEAIRSLPATDATLEQMVARGIDRGKYDATLPIRQQLALVLTFLEPLVGDATTDSFAALPRPIVNAIVNNIQALEAIVNSIPVNCQPTPPAPAVVPPSFHGAEAGVATRVERLYGELYSQLALSRPPPASVNKIESHQLAAGESEPITQDSSPRVASVVRGIKIGAQPVVITLHGIRTTAKWQKDLDECLSAAGFISKSLDFGRFGFLQFLIKRQRQKKIEWFLKEYQAIRHKYPNNQLFVIAHSFGTYVVATAIRFYGGLVQFDKIIFCGSIVSVDFPWSKVIQSKLVNQVLNDYGHLDFWAKTVGLALPDTGPSGHQGFSDTADGKVVQIRHPEWGHSHYFFELNYRDRWIRFLEGIPFEDIALEPHWHFPALWKVVIAVMALLAVFGLFYFTRDHQHAKFAPGTTSNATVSAESQDLSFWPTVASELQTLRQKTPPFGYALGSDCTTNWTNFEGKRIWVRDPRGLDCAETCPLEPLGILIEEDKAHYYDAGVVRVFPAGESPPPVSGDCFPPVDGVCAANPVIARVGEKITFKAAGLGGSGEYAFTWVADEGQLSETIDLIATFSSPGKKSATVRVTSNGQNWYCTCSVSVLAAP